MIRPTFETIILDHHLTKRLKEKEIRETKAVWITGMGYFINILKEHRTIIYN